MKLLLAMLVAGLTMAAPDARADVSAAARAFADGQAALIEGNHERAAQSFELAFHIAPTREALRSAVRARLASNQLPRAATLAQLLLTQYPDDPESATLANEVITEARVRLARIAVTCAPQCTVAVGGRAISLDAAASHVVFTTAGHHHLEITFDGDRNVKREVTLKAGDDVTLPIAPPPVKHGVESRTPVTIPARAEARPRPLPPGVAVGAAAVTVVLVGITAWSALDTSAAHDAYVKKPTPEGWTTGRSKQLRTNILLGTTAVAGVATALIAVVWTRWGSARRGPPEVAIAPDHGGLLLSLGGQF